MSEAAPAPERIAKLLARVGLCSRRDAPALDRRRAGLGRWSCADHPGSDGDGGERVRVDDTPLPAPERPRLWRYHKPAGLVTTHRDEKGRPTVFDALPKELPRVISVGRRDLNSEGLLLLSNDGALGRRLELPATGLLRRYKVRVHGEVDPDRLGALEKGITIAGTAYGPIRAGLEREQGSNAWIALALREGKNREVRRVLEHLGLPVTRLIRLSFGPFQLGNLGRGEVAEVPRKVLAEQLGKAGPVHADRRR